MPVVKWLVIKLLQGLQPKPTMSRSKGPHWTQAPIFRSVSRSTPHQKPISTHRPQKNVPTKTNRFELIYCLYKFQFANEFECIWPKLCWCNFRWISYHCHEFLAITAYVDTATKVPSAPVSRHWAPSRSSAHLQSEAAFHPYLTPQLHPRHDILPSLKLTAI